MSYMCIDFHCMPKYNYTWFLTGRRGRSEKTGNKVMCAFCAELSRASSLDCVATMHYGHTKKTCLVFCRKNHPFWRRSRRTVMPICPALKVELGRAAIKRAMERPSADAMDMPSCGKGGVCRYTETGKALMWCDVEEQIILTTVRHPVVPEGSTFHASALTCTLAFEMRRDLCALWLSWTSMTTRGLDRRPSKVTGMSWPVLSMCMS